MKKLIPYILLPFLFGCNNRQPAKDVPGANNTPAQKVDKRIETAHRFIKYLQESDAKNALNMLHCWDPKADANFNKENINKELSSITEAEKAVRLYGINDTTWKSVIDSMPNTNVIYVVKTVKLNEMQGESLSNYSLAFAFDITKPDTTLILFSFLPLN